jgi:predicted MFS family arabinose efflux permease
MMDTLTAQSASARDESQKPSLPRSLVLLMASACGIAVGNLYYNQPLLARMSATFHVHAQQIGFVPVMTQLGCAAGMLLFVPMGDILERRRLIIRLLLVVTGALALAAAAPTLWCLEAASLLIGLLSVTPHIILPFAAQLASPQERGRAVGTVLSGLLIGILLARTFSGYIGDLFGWRAVYAIAAVLMVVLAILLRLRLPQSVPTVAMSYREILRSLGHLVKTLPVLREASLIGALLFGAFSVFWTTLVFLLARPPYHFAAASSVAGLFGLVGVVGAGIAPIAGRVADIRGARFTLGIALITTAASYVVFGLFGYSLLGLAAGVILLDFGVQGAHVSNQTRIYSLMPEARSRLNTVYMVCYFIGGSLGSTLGAYGWATGHWTGACIAGGGMALAALAVFGLGR